MKKFLVIVLILLLVAAGTVAYLGSRQPAQHAVTRSIYVPQSPEQVYARISNVTALPQWRPEVKSVTVLPNIGEHMQWQENYKMGNLRFELMEDNAPLERIARISDPSSPFQGDWTYELTPKGSGTTVSITERATVNNVFFRFIMHYMLGETKTIDDYLTDLARASSHSQS